MPFSTVDPHQHGAGPFSHGFEMTLLLGLSVQSAFGGMANLVNRDQKLAVSNIIGFLGSPIKVRRN